MNFSVSSARGCDSCLFSFTSPLCDNEEGKCLRVTGARDISSPPSYSKIFSTTSVKVREAVTNCADPRRRFERRRVRSTNTSRTARGRTRRDVVAESTVGNGVALFIAQINLRTYANRGDVRRGAGSRDSYTRSRRPIRISDSCAAARSSSFCRRNNEARERRYR